MRSVLPALNALPPVTPEQSLAEAAGGFPFWAFLPLCPAADSELSFPASRGPVGRGAQPPPPPSPSPSAGRGREGCSAGREGCSAGRTLPANRRSRPARAGSQRPARALGNGGVPEANMGSEQVPAVWRAAGAGGAGRGQMPGAKCLGYWEGACSALESGACP